MIGLEKVQEGKNERVENTFMNWGCLYIEYTEVKQLLHVP